VRGAYIENDAVEGERVVDLHSPDAVAPASFSVGGEKTKEKPQKLGES
jgi:hypothetical protein